ncbi:MAG: hypothetical protein ABI606_04590 [Rhodoferax sp.]
MKYLGAGLVSLSFALTAWAGGDGSDGHTHAAQVPVVSAPISAASPRITTETDQFELVGVLEGKVLKLYLDQFGTNTPVTKAQIEVESGAWKAVATEVSPAVYAVPVELLTKPGKHPLAITVQAGDVSDLMNATLEVGQASAASAGAEHTHFWGEWAVWWGAAALSLAAVTLVVIRRRRHSRKH